MLDTHVELTPSKLSIKTSDKGDDGWDGGAIAVSGASDMRLTTSSLYANTAARGGALFVDANDPAANYISVPPVSTHPTQS